MAKNPNNCKTCEHYQQRKPEDGHCYMFADAPTEQCFQHTYPRQQEAELYATLHRVLQGKRSTSRNGQTPD